MFHIIPVLVYYVYTYIYKYLCTNTNINIFSLFLFVIVYMTFSQYSKDYFILRDRIETLFQEDVDKLTEVGQLYIDYKYLKFGALPALFYIIFFPLLFLNVLLSLTKGRREASLFLDWINSCFIVIIFINITYWTSLRNRIAHKEFKKIC